MKFICDFRQCLTVVSVTLSLLLAGRAVATDLQPVRAQDARASIGVNTHINYLDGAYANLPEVIKALKYLGVTQVRELSPSPWLAGAAPVGEYIELMRQGVRIDFMAQGGDFVARKTTDQLDILSRQQPGMISAVEGFNEVDHGPITFQGQTGPEAAIAAQKALYAVVRGNPNLKSVPIYDLTGILPLPESLAGRADFANAHLYPQNGFAPEPWFDGMAKLAAPHHLPLVVTEFGYSSLPESGWLVIGVGEAGQAKGVLTGLFCGLQNGIARTYLYQLLDEKADPQMKDREQHFGLFDATYHRKPSAEAVHNLTTILRDEGATSGSFTTTVLDLDLSALPKTVHVVAVQKSNGTFLLGLWNEANFWDHTTGKASDSGVVAAKVGLPVGFHARALYDPLQSSAPVAAFDQVSTLQIEVPDHPVLVEVRP